jgi:hypothetical protein
LKVIKSASKIDIMPYRLGLHPISPKFTAA